MLTVWISIACSKDGAVDPLLNDAGSDASEPIVIVVPPPDTRLDGCADYASVGEFESMFFPVRCATSEGCHIEGNVITTDYVSPGVTQRMLNSEPVSLCKDDRLVNAAEPDESLLLVKLEPMPECPATGTSAGDRMPIGEALSTDERDCVEAYVHALAGY